MSTSMIVTDRRGHIILQEGQMIVDKDIINKLTEQSKQTQSEVRSLQTEISTLNHQFELLQMTVEIKDTRWYPAAFLKGELERYPECKSRESLSEAGYIYSGYSERRTGQYGSRELWVKKETPK